MSQSIVMGSTDSPDKYRDNALTNVAVGVYGSPCELTGWNIINPNTSDVYVKFYNGTSGTVTVGTTTPEMTLFVPPSASVVLEHRKGSGQHYFRTAMTVACVTGLADSNSTAPTTAIYCEILYEKT